jgi:hypothetical protein
MFRHTRRALLACAATAAVLAAPSVAQADVLNDWNVIAQNQVLALRPTAHGQTRGIAMVQGAVYDAVNALRPRYQPYLLDLAALHTRPFGSRKAAIATAAHHVLVEIVAPAQVAGLDSALAATMAAIPNGRVKNEGVRVGAAAAAAMLAARDDDGFMAPFNFVIGSDPGDWRPLTPTALDPDAWVGNLVPFLIESPSLGGPKRSHERRLRGGVCRGEGDRCAEQLDENGGPDDRGNLLAGSPRRTVESTRPRPFG